MMDRRRFLAAAASLGLAGLLSPPGQAAAARRRFLFVLNPGGWDATHTLIDGFSLSGVEMEPDAEPAEAGGLPYVAHAGRPSVTAFFEQHHARSLILHGLEVPSLFHAVCTRLVMTGERSGSRADWPARLAAGLPELPLPHLVLNGPSFPGPYAGLVARAGADGQLQALASGELDGWGTDPFVAMDEARWGAVDAWLEAQEREPKSAHYAEQLDAWTGALERARAVEALAARSDLSEGDSLLDRLDTAAEALSAGLSRCVSVTHGEGLRWDTHANGFVFQPPLWRELFSGLLHLAERLETLPGEGGGSLAEETVVVVLSEMGRTPTINDSLGRHHWPWTSALLFGAGVAGGRVIGGYDDQLQGMGVDFASGEAREGGPAVTPEALGATLLALADLDPGALGATIEAAIA
ncbi:MAG: DUF1501 domain-containing protein [Alphaproteobacteria bacterium]|nr:DUF1501 domain-containing protein [Alphaproteobacteria bacterium]MCB9796833.1 DUF1501 domain-containing protein [Alphaproteobacteria bacterium]